ncbi:MAG: VOC family protein [Gallionellaceae bacterium]|nr:VOC family protein [Gallionellaceae bacterium]
MIKISALLHVSILVSNLEQARFFYETTLGLKLNPTRPDLGYPGAWYDTGANQQLHLMQLPNPENGLQRPAHGGRDRHVALAVNDLDALVHELKVAGIAYTLSKSGRRALFCRDRDDNALEFIETGQS